jgi:hypothetical protein
MGKLGQLLVARGWITVQQLTRALKNQSVVGGRLGTCLLEMDALSEDLLLKGLSEHLGVPAANLDDLRHVPDEVLQLLPEKLARRCRVVPFQALGGRLDVAMVDPRNLAYQDELAFASGKRVKVHVAHEIRVFEALERYYGEEIPSRFTLMLDRLNRSRFLWDKDKAAESTPGSLLDAPMPDLLGRSELLTAPLLPELAPPASLRAVPSPPAPARTPAPPPAPRTVHRPAPVSPPAAASAAPAVLPAPRQQPRSVALTPEERAALGDLGSPEPLPPQAVPLPPPVAAAPVAPVAPPAPVAAVQPPPPRRPAPASLPELEAALQETNDREEVARTVLSFLERGHRRVALFQVTKERVGGWMAQGEGIDPKAFDRFSVGFDQPSLFLNLRHGSGFHLGPMAPMPAHKELARAWGGELPQDCVLLPVRIKDRLVAVVYADGARKGLGGVELPQLQRLTASLAAALERCILHKKRGATRS